MKENAELREALRGLVYLPIEAPDGSEPARHYGVAAYPTFVLWNAKGETMGRWLGYGGPASWDEVLGELMAEPLTIVEREARYRSRPRAADAIILGRTAYASARYRDADVYLAGALEMDPVAAKAADARRYRFLARYRGASSEEFSPGEMAAVAEEILRADDAAPSEIFAVTRSLVSAIRFAGEEPILPLLAMAHPRVLQIQDESYREQRTDFLLNHALLIEKDPPKALTLLRELMPAGWEEDPAQLNRFAWWCFEQRVNLQEAEALARRAVELAEPGPDKANILDTLAELVNLNGRPEEALQLIRQALELNPENDYLLRQEEKFAEVVGEDRVS